MRVFFGPLFFTIIAVTYSAFPPTQKCQLSDSSCLKEVAQDAVAEFTAGIPEPGAEILDPMQVDSIKVDLSGLKLNIKNSDIKGLKTTTIDKLSIDMAKKQLQLAFHVDIVFTGKYKASGQLLILPISGDGDITIKLKNLELEMTMPFEVVKDSTGKDIIDLKSYKYVYDVKDNAHFHLTKLFNGNKALSDTMLTFMNQNWKALTQEFGVPMLTKPVQKIFASIRAYLKSQPISDIAL